MDREYIPWFFQGSLEEQDEARAKIKAVMASVGYKEVWADVCLKSCYVVFRRDR